MRKLLVLVEGQTEEVFVRDVLAPHLETRGLAAQEVALKTKRVKGGRHFRGGVTSKKQVLGDVRLLLGDSSAVAVTTILDDYGLPRGFCGMVTRPVGSPKDRVEHVEAAFAAEIYDRRFIPHILLHEFEAWIYADPKAAAGAFLENPGAVAQLIGIAQSAGGPESIDEGPKTAPSKRLKNLFPRYRKTLHGALAVKAIGLAPIRRACPHAAAWLDRLEQL